MYASPSNLITGNIVEGFMYGIRLAGTRDYKSTGNTIHGNDFNNMNNTYEITAANTWDDGLRGNYWSDYRGVDNDGDGVGDTPYVINSENVDRYPLVKPVHKVEYTVTVKSAYGAVEGSGVYARGSNVTISLDRSVIDYGNGTRRVFKGWFRGSEFVSRERSFTFNVDKPVEILAEWDTEYEVKVSSEKGAVTGSGWYKAGDTVRISLTPTTFEDLFNRYTFEYFSADGTVVSTSPIFTLTVNKPVNLIAHWKTEPKIASLKITNMSLLIAIAIILLLIILLAIIAAKRRKSK